MGKTYTRRPIIDIWDKKRKLNTCMIDSLIDIEYTIAIMIRERERERRGEREEEKWDVDTYVL